MMNLVRKFLSKIMIAVFAIGICMPVSATTSNLQFGTGVGMSDIGDFGSWATENNRKLFLDSLTYDIEQFSGPSQNRLVENYVPVEAKVGMAFMNAFSFIAGVLDSSLVRFTIMFIIIAYGFWIAFEAYTIITGQNNAKDKVLEIGKVGLKVVMWVAILSIGPAKTFMLLISPIMYLGTLFSDVILDATASVAGIDLPDTCSAIHEYAKAHIESQNIIDANSAANIMCVPTRLSGFCYTAIKLGWGWMKYGIGSSLFSFLCGGIFVGGFVYLAWKFAFMAFGVIAELFLGIIMLPFTAIAETVNKTTYKGIAGNIYNGFTKLFSAESLNAQIGRFVNAALHFVVLSIVIAVCAAMLSSVYTTDVNAVVPRIDNQGFVITVFVSALVWWLAKNASRFANEIGGTISYEIGQNLQKDASTLWTKTKSGAKTVIDIIKKAK
jgi:hypothetical protein